MAAVPSFAFLQTGAWPLVATERFEESSMILRYIVLVGVLWAVLGGIPGCSNRNKAEQPSTTEEPAPRQEKPGVAKDR
jgi:hypothetical protein